MDKETVEKCREFKEHLTQQTHTDSTAQSNKNTAQVIKNAKKLLLSDVDDYGQIEMSTMSILKYAREIQNFDPKPKNSKFCSKNKVTSDSNLFLLPHPQNNFNLINNQILNTCNRDLEEMTDVVLNKVEKLNKRNIEDNIKSNDEEISVPELVITPQIAKEVAFLEIKKINLEENEVIDFEEIQPEKEQILNRYFDKWRNFVKEKRKSVERSKDRKKEVLLKSFQSWKNFAKEHKGEKFKRDRIEKFYNTVLNYQKQINDKKKEPEPQVLVKPKRNVSIQMQTKMASFEERCKAQNNLIKVQKEKIEEQNRIIEQLKLNKIEKDINISLKSAQEQRKALLSLSKPKPKPIQKSQPVETKENKLASSLKLSKAPKIIQMMEERAKQREEKRLLVQERRRIIEEERKREAEESIQNKIRVEAEEKQRRMEEVKRHKDEIRQIELKKQMEKKEYMAKFQKASNHYKTKLKQQILIHFRMLLYNMRINIHIANSFYDQNITIKCFKAWYNFTNQIMIKKKQDALILYNGLLIKNALCVWKSFTQHMKQNNQVAKDCYELRLQIRCFSAWHQYICEYRLQKYIQLEKASKYYERILLMHCLSNWRSLREILQIEKIQNERKRKWRLRVAEILPDYNPLKDYNND